MTKYPKAWHEAIDRAHSAPVKRIQNYSMWKHSILVELNKAGALKDPPKPREFWICEVCGQGYVTTKQHDRLPKCRNYNHEWIHVREVSDE